MLFRFTHAGRSRKKSGLIVVTCSTAKLAGTGSSLGFNGGLIDRSASCQTKMKLKDKVGRKKNIYNSLVHR